jgi:hypothetical protein
LADAEFPLRAAQLVIARRYGFRSCARLKRHVEVIEWYSRFPAAGGPADTGTGLARYRDIPSDQPWQTALHGAAEAGDLDMARTLLRLGADPDIPDERFGETRLSWARYFGHELLIELLEPITTVPITTVPAASEGGDEASSDDG